MKVNRQSIATSRLFELKFSALNVIVLTLCYSPYTLPSWNVQPVQLWLGMATKGMNMTLITILLTLTRPIISEALASKQPIKANTVSSSTVNWTVALITWTWSVGGCNFRGWVQPWLELSGGQSDRGGRRCPWRRDLQYTPKMSPDITSPSHLLLCCPVQTRCSDWTRRGGNDGRMKWRG